MNDKEKLREALVVFYHDRLTSNNLYIIGEFTDKTVYEAAQAHLATLDAASKVDALITALQLIKTEAIGVEAMKAPSRALGAVLFLANEALSTHLAPKTPPQKEKTNE
jgi:hypothetical protein